MGDSALSLPQPSAPPGEKPRIKFGPDLADKGLVNFRHSCEHFGPFGQPAIVVFLSRVPESMPLKPPFQLVDLMDPEGIQPLLDIHGDLLGMTLALLDLEGDVFAGRVAAEPPAWVHPCPVHAGGHRIGTLTACLKATAIGTPPSPEAVLASLAQILGEIGELKAQVLREKKARRRTGEVLRATETRFSTLVEQMSEGLIVVDLEGRVTFTNPHLEHLLGYSQAMLVGRPLTTILVEEDRPRFLQRLERRRRGLSDTYELTFLARDGRLIPCALSGTPLRDASGVVVAAFAILTDISERRRTMEALRHSEAEFRSVFENMQDVFYRTDPEGRILMVSPSGLRLLGHASEQEVLGKSVAELWWKVPEDRQRLLEALQTHGDVWNYEVTLHRTDGTPVVVSTNSHFYYDNHGKFLGVEGVFFDITEQKRAQQALQRSEAAYRRLVNQVHDIIYAYQPDGTVSFASDRVRMLGYEPEEVTGSPLLAFVHPEDRQPAMEVLRKAIVEGQPGCIECRIQRKDGSYEWVEEQSEPFFQDGRVVEVHGVIRIVTARRKAEEALRRSEHRYRTLLEAQGEGVAYVDDQEAFVFVNPAAETIFGMPQGGLVGMNLSDFTTPFEFQRVREQSVLRSQGLKSTYELQICRPDGELRTLLVTATPHASFDDQGAGVLGIFRDITDWRETEANLRRLSSAITQASDAILIADLEGIIQYANPAAEDLTGHREGGLVGTGLRKLALDSEGGTTTEDIWRKVRHGDTWSGRMSLQRLDGTHRATLTTLSPVRDEHGTIQHVITDSRDVTREQELEAQLRHSQRLEAIGVLAGGIAHDFNNILTPILGYAELAQLHLEKEPRIQEYIGEILSAGRRAAALVEQILTFSRQGEQDRCPVRLVSVVKEALKLLRAALPSTITIDTDLSEEAGSVLADPGQLHQVVVNLCTNAFHAMRENGGVLHIDLREVCLLENRTVHGTILTSGTYLRLVISDTGCGMDEDTRKRAFLPFFTTKKVGEGTGLGLSIVHGIITGLGGAIDLESEPGQGATFILLLPTHQTEPREAPRKPMSLPHGQERILVVDDEIMVGAMLRDMLSELGYQVAVLDSAVDALQTLRLAPEHWDLIISDMTMPEMTGLELAQRMKEHGINRPVILMTGYSEGLTDQLATGLGLAAVLRKPVPLPSLTRLIRETLDRAATEA